MTDTGNTSVTVQLLRLPYEHSYFLKLLTHPPIKASCNIFGSNFVKVVLARIFVLCVVTSLSLCLLYMGKK